jgi:hypothetical protein
MAQQDHPHQPFHLLPALKDDVSTLPCDDNIKKIASLLFSLDKYFMPVDFMHLIHLKRKYLLEFQKKARNGT